LSAKIKKKAIWPQKNHQPFAVPNALYKKGDTDGQESNWHINRASKHKSV
jgi:hypothetical protein